MRFPGRRHTKHYFPVEDKTRTSFDENLIKSNSVYVVGIDQILVDIEIPVDEEWLKKNDIPKGQSVVIADDFAHRVYTDFKNQNAITGIFPGGAVGNTLHNFCTLSDSPAVVLGSFNKHIEVGDDAFKYLCCTSSKVNFSYLHPSPKPIGRALCFVTPDGERTFAISKGCMNDMPPSALPSKLIEQSGLLLLSAYVFRDETSNICKTTVEASERALKANVPVLLSLGASSLVEAKKEFLTNFVEKYVSVLAMNQAEAFAFTGIDDPLLAIDKILEMTDIVLLTVGSKGLYIGGWIDRALARETKDPLHTKSIVEYNKYEYSRGMRKRDCSDPVKIFSHINPFMGGPHIIQNTNGAGDAALAALIHDMSANLYHRQRVPNSPKHNGEYLTYSSLSQISKYANRVSFEVLSQNSPRLLRGLPEKEDNLEEAYWSH
jgi:inosine kinase